MWAAPTPPRFTLPNATSQVGAHLGMLFWVALGGDFIIGLLGEHCGRCGVGLHVSVSTFL